MSGEAFFQLLMFIKTRAIEKLTAFVKIRSYSASPTELWLEQWSPPLSVQIKVNDSEPLIAWAEKKPPQEYAPAFQTASSDSVIV